ncbi:MAG: mechanosensitive ion channel family protein [Acidobacteria bacterium]|nr:MAG: mechanosensitive ion channel family protein [Acidobacteriota bacterium]REK09798.1 MAG: mechanosensitive ion channel family protein [Acidobacteriota bacterium]
MVTLVALFLVLASLLSWFLKRVVASWFRKTETKLDDHLLSALTPPIYTTVLAFGLRVAVTRLELGAESTERIADLLTTVAVIVWMVAAIRIGSLLLGSLADRADALSFVSRKTLPLFDNLSKVVVVLLSAYVILNVWGQDITGLLAAGGIAGIALGFAARDTLANLFAGIFIFADSPYQIGDFINLDTGERGRVTEIGIRSTRLLTRDDVEITIPNAVMGNAKIINETGGPHPKFRLRIAVGVAYGSDVDHVERVLLDVAHQEELVCAEPEARVRLRGFGASSLDFELLCWVDEPVLRGRAMHELHRAVYKRFQAEGIEIPYAKQDVYLRQMPVGTAGADDDRQRRPDGAWRGSDGASG